MKLDPQKTVFLIDGSSFLYRAYYGMRPLHTSKGEPVHAVYGFCRMINKLIEKFSPYYISIVWDSKGKTVRHEVYEEYKATRQAPPSDLFDQKQRIMEFADLIGLHQVAKSGYEADDIMFSLAKEWQEKGYQVVLITSDKDMGQVLSDNVYLYDYFKDQQIDKQAFEEKRGFAVRKLPFYFALLGDASDNIPGVHGIGKKIAQELVEQFDSLDDLYAHIQDIKKPRVRNALEANKDNAFLSRKLFLLQYIKTDVSQDDLTFDSRNWINARPLFKVLELKSLLDQTGITKEQQAALIEEKITAIKKHNFITVTTPIELAQVVAVIEQAKECAVDTEADGVRPLRANMVGISLCVQEGTAYYIPFAHQTDAIQLSYAAVADALRPVFEDPSIKKYLHNAKFDQLILTAHGIEMRGVAMDTMIAASLVTRDWQRIGLKFLSTFYFDEPMLTFDEMVKSKKLPNFSYVPLDLATYYSANDAHQTFKLAKLFAKELVKENMNELFYDIEMPLSQVLYLMEKRGIFVEAQVLSELDQSVSKALEHIEHEIFALIDQQERTINLNSPKQVEQLLFYDLKLPPQKKRTKGTGYSTDQEVLEALSKLHPVPALILKYRELFKLQRTYIQALPTYINPRDNRVHTTFSQTRVATGRLSSLNPNLQNIPASGPGIEVRTAFQPDQGRCFISADYSQIELRVLAYLSKDEALTQAFLQNRDIHCETAVRLFDVTFDAVTNEQRQTAKRINFSILYGLTPYGLSKDLNIPFGDAKQYIEKYFAQYPGVRAWMDRIVQQTEEKGYVTTYWGRRRYIPGIYEKNRVLYDEAKRVAINTVAQGTAAEIMKQGMIVLQERFETEQINAQMLLQIHDELLISAQIEQVAAVETAVKEVLEGIVDWNVPLKVTIRHGANWKEVSK